MTSERLKIQACKVLALLNTFGCALHELEKAQCCNLIDSVLEGKLKDRQPIILGRNISLYMRNIVRFQRIYRVYNSSQPLLHYL